MPVVSKIDSNITELRYAEEESFKILPVSPTWTPLEPNSYNDFGGQTINVSRNPINPSRQQRKGVVTDLEASSGFSLDLTQNNLQDMFQGFFFADIRTKSNGYLITGGIGDISIDVGTGDFPRLEDSNNDLDTYDLTPGEWIFIGGDVAGNNFDTVANNGFKRIREITSGYIELDKSDVDMVDEVAAAKTIQVYFGDVLKNELSSLIKRRTYTFERQLGVPDTDNPAEIQAEYIDGATPNELTFNIPTANKMTVDLTFIGADNITIDGATPLFTGTRPELLDEDAFNTSSDFNRVKLAVVNTGAILTPLFAFAQNVTITINNNIVPDKAVGTLGAFDMTAGTFQVGGSMTAYFADVVAIDAIRNNSDITLDIIIVKNNAGIVIDLPLISLGDGRPNVTQDEPITIPLNINAATAAKIDPLLDHTAMITFFNTLPDVADA